MGVATPRFMMSGVTMGDNQKRKQKRVGVVMVCQWELVRVSHRGGGWERKKRSNAIRLSTADITRLGKKGNKRLVAELANSGRIIARKRVLSLR